MWSICRAEKIHVKYYNFITQPYSMSLSGIFFCLYHCLGGIQYLYSRSNKDYTEMCLLYYTVLFMSLFYTNELHCYPCASTRTHICANRYAHACVFKLGEKRNNNFLSYNL